MDFHGEPLFRIEKHRKEDTYTPGRRHGKRPDYAVVVYCNLIRSVYKDVPIIAGGIDQPAPSGHYDITGPTG